MEREGERLKRRDGKKVGKKKGRRERGRGRIEKERKMEKE